MKFLSMFFVVASAITVSAQIPTFGQYSNLRDQQFRILNGITIWSNYWDAARSAYVYKATINSEKQGKNGLTGKIFILKLLTLLYQLHKMIHGITRD